MKPRRPLPTAPSDGFRERRLIEHAGDRLRRMPAAPAARSMLKRVYHAALMLQTRGRGLECTLPEGEVVRARPEHRHLSWNVTEYTAFRAETTRGMVVLDVGANVGAYALLFGQWVGPEGAVYAFEPGPHAFDGLARHVSLNQLEGTVRPVMSAVGSEEGTVPLLVSGPSGECRLVTASADTAARTVPTPVTTIDRFCACERIDPGLVKIDVEGWEVAVLRGARQTIRRRPNLALFVELHPSIWPLIGVSREDLLAELEAQSLVIEPLVPGEDVWSVEGVCVRLRRV